MQYISLCAKYSKITPHQEKYLASEIATPLTGIRDKTRIKWLWIKFAGVASKSNNNVMANTQQTN